LKRWVYAGKKKLGGLIKRRAEEGALVTYLASFNLLLDGLPSAMATEKDNIQNLLNFILIIPFEYLDVYRIAKGMSYFFQI
jgi:hypothetical protein